MVLPKKKIDKKNKHPKAEKKAIQSDDWTKKKNKSIKIDPCLHVCIDDVGGGGCVLHFFVCLFVWIRKKNSKKLEKLGSMGKKQKKMTMNEWMWSKILQLKMCVCVCVWYSRC